PMLRLYCHLSQCITYLLYFFFSHTATTEIYTLSLHDALPISPAGPTVDRRQRDHRQGLHQSAPRARAARRRGRAPTCDGPGCGRDRKSTRLNSSHVAISYAVLCLKKKILDERVDPVVDSRSVL